jgi:hypothetical protein
MVRIAGRGGGNEGRVSVLEDRFDGGLEPLFIAFQRFRWILGSAVLDVSGRCGFRTVGTAKELSRNFRSMPDNLAAAVFAHRSDRLYGALKAIERVPCAGRDDIETLVVFIATNFTLCHRILLILAGRV